MSEHTGWDAEDDARDGDAASCRGHGKVIVIGEHAAVYGYPVLAGALDRGVVLRARRTRGPLALRVTGWDIDVRADEEHPVAPALEAIGAALGATDGWTLAGESDLPPAAGLGSSAALAVAMTRALAAGLGRTLHDDDVEAIAAGAERCFHGNPSGVDVALATRGGLGRFVRGLGLRAIACAPLTLAIGLSGERRTTAAMVERVAEARRERPAVVDADLAALGADAERAAAMLGRPIDGAALAALGTILADGHARLARLGVSTPTLDAMVASARVDGALGAKLTGGGGGGAVIALAPGREDAVVAGWRRLGRDGFVARIGARE
jgi:mevalonate kinase